MLYVALAIIVIAFWGGKTIRLLSEVKKQKQTIEHYQGVEQQQKERLEKLLQDQEKLKKDAERLQKEKAELQKQAKPIVRVASVKSDCRQYLPLLSKYPWNVESALLVMSKESGCRANAVSSTNDHGLFQLHGQAIYDPARNIAVAYGKYTSGRVGSNNWSAWYAVCTPGNSPQPKYPGISCR